MFEKRRPMSYVIWNSTNWEALAGPSIYGIFHGMMAMGAKYLVMVRTWNNDFFGPWQSALDVMLGAKTKPT